MLLSQAAIEKLRAQFASEFGVQLSNEAAQEVGLKIVRFVYAKELRQRNLYYDPLKDIMQMLTHPANTQEVFLFPAFKGGSVSESSFLLLDVSTIEPSFLIREYATA